MIGMPIMPGDTPTAYPSPSWPIRQLHPTSLIKTFNDEQIAAIFWFLDDSNDSADMCMVAAAFGYSAQAVLLSDTGPEELYEEYHDGTKVLDRWNPAPPSPDHKLAAKFDSEDGPIAWFIAPLASKARDALRKAFTQALKAEG